MSGDDVFTGYAPGCDGMERELFRVYKQTRTRAGRLMASAELHRLYADIREGKRGARRVRMARKRRKGYA